MLLVLLPALVAHHYSRVIGNYDNLLNIYECNLAVCQADFDGDGVSGQLAIVRASAPEGFDSWYVARDSEKELLRIPRRSFDNTLRTHVALRYDIPRARLIVYDHIKGKEAPRSEVYAFDGSKLVLVPPQEKDTEILAAIGARDDTGTLNRWAIFEAFLYPILIGFYLLLALVLLFLLTRQFKEGRIYASKS